MALSFAAGDVPLLQCGDSMLESVDCLVRHLDLLVQQLNLHVLRYEFVVDILYVSGNCLYVNRILVFVDFSSRVGCPRIILRVKWLSMVDSLRGSGVNKQGPDGVLAPLLDGVSVLRLSGVVTYLLSVVMGQQLSSVRI